MWIIISMVTAIGFGSHPHEIASVKHFQTRADCETYIPADAEMLLDELAGYVEGPFHLESHCEIDDTGDPA
jgi:hypothetical protein